MSWFDTVMSTDYVQICIPLFLLAIGGEAYFSWKKGMDLYRVNDTLNSLSCGILNQFVLMMTKGLSFFLYGYLVHKAGIIDFLSLSAEQQWAGGLALFFGVDLCYYWFHRSAHRINFGWATHVVHHQSEEYNLSTALRQGAFQELFSFPFYLPLAIIGFPLPWFLAMSGLNTTWQFWIHTRAIKKMPGWFEFVFNTPSHHRVHHGQNEKYLDRNHGGIFIFWDRLFGTFQQEEETVRYGITTGLNSWNPLWAQVHYFVFLWQMTVKVKGLKRKIAVWCMGPDWIPREWSGPSGHPKNVKSFCKYNPVITISKRNQALMFFFGALCLAVLFLYASEDQNLRLLLSLSATLLLWCCGKTLEHSVKRQGVLKKIFSGFR